MPNSEVITFRDAEGSVAEIDMYIAKLARNLGITRSDLIRTRLANPQRWLTPLVMEARRQRTKE